MEAIAANILLEGLAVNALAQCETPVTLVTTDSREVSTTGASGVIVGRALLEGRFTVEEAIECWPNA